MLSNSELIDGGGRGGVMGIPLVLKTRRCRSTGLGLWVLHILRPPRKVSVILPTMIISVQVRIISWRKSLGNSLVHLQH